MKDKDAHKPETSSGVSRRDFMKISAVTAAVPIVLGPQVVEAAGEEVAVHGPGKVPVTLNVNGKKLSAELEPRVTLLDALRGPFDLTGAKRVCDRGTCGACTVLLDGKPVYACSVLAIDAQGAKITTIEALAEGDKLSPVMAGVRRARRAAVRVLHARICRSHNALPRRRIAKPSADDMRRGLSGNYCRCGTYDGIRAVALAQSGGKQS